MAEKATGQERKQFLKGFHKDLNEHSNEYSKENSKTDPEKKAADLKSGQDEEECRNQRMQQQRRQIRKEMKQQRAELTGAERKAKDRALTENLLAVLDFPDHFMENSDLVVYAYASFGMEADTFLFLETLWKRKILTALPRVEGNEMKFYLVSGREELTEGYMGILEPSEQCLPAQSPRAVVITPGLAFTKAGERLGYGGGFYDRFFEAEPLHRKVAIAYGFQVLRDLPSQPWDVRVDQLVTDEEIITISDVHR